jgi:DNA-binding NtrC family response regulator
MSRVLFVSHDGDLCAVGARILRDAGHDVTTAAHAGHAVLACAKSDFDVLVIENRMPDESSRTIIDRIRRYCPDVQVVRLCDPVSTVVGKGIAVVRPFTADALLDAVIESAANAAVVYIRRGATTR